jgi:uncharacterized membrane protein YciS (DUF1049 family)
LSAIPVIEYLIGIFVFGFLDLIMNDVVMSAREAYWGIVNGTAVQPMLSLTDQLAIWFWHGILIAYLILGAFWLWRKYTEPQVRY